MRGPPTAELQQLKTTLFMQFPQYWKAPHEFEPVWKTATEAIGQACKRLSDRTVNLIQTCTYNNQKKLLPIHVYQKR